MIHAIFREVLQMSMASVLVIAVILVVRLLLKQFPRIFSYALWGVLLIRLLLPFSFEVPYRTIHTQIFEDVGVQHEQSTEFTQIECLEFPEPERVEVSKPIYPYIWVGGMGILIVYYIAAYIRLHYKLVGAIPYDQDEDIYFADYIQVPFVIGAMYPKIYLPSSLTEKEFDYIILHEKYHIRRKDHILKPLALLALTIHWFNPFVWIAFFMAAKDMEMSCDEAVLRTLTEEEKNDYLASLLELATGKKLFPGLSIAFGEGDTKQRIKNAVKWKRPRIIWIIIAIGITICVLFICLIIPKNKTIKNPYNWIKQCDLEDFRCEHVDEDVLRDLIYVINELKSTDFSIYTDYTAEIELKMVIEGEPVSLIYGDGITVFAFDKQIKTGKIWGVEDKDLAFCIKEIKSNREANIETENYVEPWKPTKEDVEVIREKLFASVSEEDIVYMKDLVKVMNLELESAYLYENRFEEYEDPNHENWNRLDYDTYRLYVNGVGKRIKDDLLKQDIEEMLVYIDQMEKEKDVEALRSFYYKLHDMDYFLFRYGANELWMYIHDKSFVTTFFDSLHIYRGLSAD